MISKRDAGLKSLCLLDWQTTRYGPPVLDVLYTIFGATDGKFRKQHYDQLLHIYHSSLSNAIRALGSDPSNLYTFQQFQDQMKKFGEFALLWGFIQIRVRVANADDISDLDEYVELVDSGKNVDFIRAFTGKQLDKFTMLANELVTDLVNYGYLDNLRTKCSR